MRDPPERMDGRRKGVLAWVSQRMETFGFRVVRTCGFFGRFTGRRFVFLNVSGVRGFRPFVNAASVVAMFGGQRRAGFPDFFNDRICHDRIWMSVAGVQTTGL